LYPQHFTDPPPNNAHAWLPPTAIASTPLRRPETSTGTELSWLSPSKLRRTAIVGRSGGGFAVEVNGQPVLNERERAHMNDVRTVFRGLWVLAAISAVVVIAATRRHDRSRTWQTVRRGALGLTVGVVVLGAVAVVAFDQLFETFHEIFFPAGSYLFDPRTDRLVQLFPFQFWDETAMAVGVVIIALALSVAILAGRRARRSVASVSGRDLAAVPEPGS